MVESSLFIEREERRESDNRRESGDRYNVRVGFRCESACDAEHFPFGSLVQDEAVRRLCRPGSEFEPCIRLVETNAIVIVDPERIESLVENQVPPRPDDVAGMDFPVIATQTMEAHGIRQISGVRSDDVSALLRADVFSVSAVNKFDFADQLVVSGMDSGDHGDEACDDREFSFDLIRLSFEGKSVDHEQLDIRF